MKLLQPLFAALLLASPAALPSAQATPADSAREVERLVATANSGKPPVLWFASEPKINRGTGSPAWSAQSGGQLAARGLDPWGRPASAFGLAPDAKGGVAVSGSTTSGVINPQAGSVLFFFRPSETAVPPMLLFSHADWGAPNFLSLRINAVGARMELALAVADSRPSNKTTHANFATLTPGAWTFVALSWQEIDGLCRIRYWAGDLAKGELTEGELDTTPLSPTPAIFFLAGRRADTSTQYSTAPLLFSGGLLNHFAVYDAPLSEDVVKRIYLAASPR